MKTALPALLVATTLFALLAPACAAREEKTPAPDFTVSDLQGKTLRLADFKGKVLVLNFWATWCPPCREEIPDLITVYKEFQSQGLEIIGLSVDRMTAERLNEWVTDIGITYPVGVATQDHVRAFKPGDYIPATLVIDPDGNIRHRHVGAIDKDTLVALFKQYK